MQNFWIRSPCECSSSHPHQQESAESLGKNIDRSRVTEIEEVSGNGVTAKVDGIAVAAGNEKLMEKLGIAYRSCSHVGTVVHMAVDGQIRRTYSDFRYGETPRKTGD